MEAPITPTVDRHARQTGEFHFGTCGEITIGIYTIRELCREIVADGAIRPGRSVLSSTDDHRHDRPCRGIVSGASEARAWLGPSRQARLGQSGSALGLVQAPLEASRLRFKLSRSAHFPFLGRAATGGDAYRRQENCVDAGASERTFDD